MEYTQENSEGIMTKKRTKAILWIKVFIPAAVGFCLIGSFYRVFGGNDEDPIVQEPKMSRVLFRIDVADSTVESAETLIRSILSRLDSGAAAPALSVDYPLEHSLFPPDMVPPTFLFHDPAETANLWLVDVTVQASQYHMYVLTDGKPPEKIFDSRCLDETNVYQEPDYQASAKAWTPAPDLWKIIQAAPEKDVRITIRGLRGSEENLVEDIVPRILSQAAVTVKISADPVGAPIFYRDVPLMPAINNEGVIKPLANFANGYIQWRLRDLSQLESQVVMEGLPTCGNCHSFSKDGKTLGMDMDGPEGDKGAYAVTTVRQHMVIESEDVFSWNDYNPQKEAFGLFSRVSPDGRYVASSVDEELFVVNYMDFRFLQTFYPSRGLLAIYDRETGVIKTLHGADDPAHVHCNPVWSPDGESLLFLRAEARSPFNPDATLPAAANDPNELQIKYDIYRIPFNNGKGGEALPVPGASINGKSNSFPKFSPDGKWIVFVQANNGLLMRPDSELYIIPESGGEARRMRCNTDLMNSWHSWSPNSRWLVFSSKVNKPFTEMFLTHIDEEGNDSPAILVPNSTAYNRAVNLPEFVNTAPAGIQDIQVPAVDYRRYLDKGKELILKKDWDEALAELKKSLEEKPDFALTLGVIGYILSEQGEVEEAIQYLEKALKINPNHYLIHSLLGTAYINLDDLPRARRHFQTAYELNPLYYLIHFNLGNMEIVEGRPEKAIPFYEKALELNPECKEARLNLGLTLNRLGDFSRAVEHLSFVVQNHPEIFEAHWALAVALNRLGDVKEAIAEYEIVLELSPDEPNTLNNLGWILATNPYEELRDGDRAVELAERLNRKTDYKIPRSLDILAAAYAQTRQFDLAEKYASISLQMTEVSDPKHELRLNLLKLYKDGKPYPVKR